MKITLFTSNKHRHNFLINLLSKNCKELYVIQETDTVFQGLNEGRYIKSPTIKNYFDKVNNAQKTFFANTYINNQNTNLNLFPLQRGDLNKCSIKYLNDFLKSDLYIVFGCSYIKGDIIKFLVKKKAINIHMGVSPFYRGSDCNFWALYDNNPHLVGSTIHLISEGLDSGPILYNAMSKIKTDPFAYSMSTVKSAFISLSEKIKNETIFDIEPITQNKNLELRYSKKSEFVENIVDKFSSKKIDLNSKEFDLSSLIRPFFLEN